MSIKYYNPAPRLSVGDIPYFNRDVHTCLIDSIIIPALVQPDVVWGNYIDFNIAIDILQRNGRFIAAGYLAIPAPQGDGKYYYVASDVLNELNISYTWNAETGKIYVKYQSWRPSWLTADNKAMIDETILAEMKERWKVVLPQPWNELMGDWLDTDGDGVPDTPPKELIVWDLTPTELPDDVFNPQPPQAYDGLNGIIDLKLLFTFMGTGFRAIIDAIKSGIRS